MCTVTWTINGKTNVMKFDLGNSDEREMCKMLMDDLHDKQLAFQLS